MVVPCGGPKNSPRTSISCSYFSNPQGLLAISFFKVTDWPPIGKIAAHSSYDMFHGISA